MFPHTSAIIATPRSMADAVIVVIKNCDGKILIWQLFEKICHYGKARTINLLIKSLCGAPIHKVISQYRSA